MEFLFHINKYYYHNIAHKGTSKSFGEALLWKFRFQSLSFMSIGTKFFFILRNYQISINLMSINGIILIETSYFVAGSCVVLAGEIKKTWV